MMTAGVKNEKDEVHLIVLYPFRSSLSISFFLNILDKTIYRKKDINQFQYLITSSMQLR